MYRPAHYVNDDPEHVWNFIQEFPFATFIQQGEELIATHIPVLPVGDKDKFKLFGHIANHNKQFRSIEDGADALLIFHGPNSYISSSWYQEQEVSTWNYLAVHINAKIRVQTLPELQSSLKLLTDHFESKQERPLYYDDIEESVISSQIYRITGFWMYPQKIQGIAKLSQKMDAKDIDSITSELGKSNDPQSQVLCEHMKRSL